MGKQRNRSAREERIFSFLEEHAITINTFLKRVLYLCGSNLMKESLSHKDLVKMFPNLQRTSYDIVMDDPSMVSTGEIVIIIDANANIIPYENPVFKLLKDNSISVDEFVTKYLGQSCTVSSHKELVDKYPKLQKVSYEFAILNSELIYEEKIIIVKDSIGNICPYINPIVKDFLRNDEFEQVMDGELWSEDSEEWTFESETAPVHSYDLESMSNYELVTLMELYTKTGQWHSYEVVRRELVSRDDCKHANKVSKRKALIKAEKRSKQEDY